MYYNKITYTTASATSSRSGWLTQSVKMLPVCSSPISILSCQRLHIICPVAHHTGCRSTAGFLYKNIVSPLLTAKIMDNHILASGKFGERNPTTIGVNN